MQKKKIYIWIMQGKLLCSFILTLEKEFALVHQAVSSMSCRARLCLWVRAGMKPHFWVPKPAHGTLPTPQVLLSLGGSMSSSAEQSLEALEEKKLPWSSAMKQFFLESVQQRSEQPWYFLAVVSYSVCQMSHENWKSSEDSVVTPFL